MISRYIYYFVSLIAERNSYLKNDLSEYNISDVNAFFAKWAITAPKKQPCLTWDSKWLTVSRPVYLGALDREGK